MSTDGREWLFSNEYLAKLLPAEELPGLWYDDGINKTGNKTRLRDKGHYRKYIVGGAHFTRHRE